MQLALIATLFLLFLLARSALTRGLLRRDPTLQASLQAAQRKGQLLLHYLPMLGIGTLFFWPGPAADWMATALLVVWAGPGNLKTFGDGKRVDLSTELLRLQLSCNVLLQMLVFVLLWGRQLMRALMA